MSVKVIDTIKPKNNGSFPVVEAIDVAVSDSLRLPEALNAKANAAALAETNAAVAQKASQSTVNTLITTMSTKANQSSLDATNTALASKANSADLINTNISLTTKANTADVNASVANLQSQIDALVTPVTQDAEVENARVDGSGTAYNTLKARIDANVQQLHDELVDFSNKEFTAGLSWTIGKIVDTSTDPVDFTAIADTPTGMYSITECSAGDIFTLNGYGYTSGRLFCFTDENKNVLEVASANRTVFNETITAPENTKYLIININKTGNAVKGKDLARILKEFNPYVTPEMYGAVGDGVTDDTVAVRRAIQAGSIIVLNKTYLISQIDITNLNDRKIVGKGALKVNQPLDHSQALNFTQCQNIELSGIKIITNNVSDFKDLYAFGYTTLIFHNCKNVSINNVYIKDCTDAIRISNSQYCTIEKCEVCNCGEETIVLYASRNIVVRDNFLHDHCGDCILMKPGTKYTQEQYTIVNNTIMDGVAATGRGFRGGGITLNYEDGSTRNAKDLVITGNQISNVIYGVVLYSVDNAIISDNVIDKVVSVGVGLLYDAQWSWSNGRFNNCIVANNIVTDCYFNVAYQYNATYANCLAIGNVQRLSESYSEELLSVDNIT